MVAYFKRMVKYYRSNHLFHLFGEDDKYTNAWTWYKNLDKLVILLYIYIFIMEGLAYIKIFYEYIRVKLLAF